MFWVKIQMKEIEKNQVGRVWAFVTRQDERGSVVRSIWGWSEDYVDYVVGYNVTMDSEEVVTGYVRLKMDVSFQEAQMIIGDGFVALCKPVREGDLDYIMCEREDYGTPPQRNAPLDLGAWRNTRVWKDVITDGYATWLHQRQQQDMVDEANDDDIYAVYTGQ